MASAVAKMILDSSEARHKIIFNEPDFKCPEEAMFAFVNGYPVYGNLRTSAAC